MRSDVQEVVDELTTVYALDQAGMVTAAILLAGAEIVGAIEALRYAVEGK